MIARARGSLHGAKLRTIAAQSPKGVLAGRVDGGAGHDVPLGVPGRAARKPEGAASWLTTVYASSVVSQTIS